MSLRHLFLNFSPLTTYIRPFSHMLRSLEPSGFNISYGGFFSSMSVSSINQNPPLSTRSRYPYFHFPRTQIPKIQHVNCLSVQSKASNNNTEKATTAQNSPWIVINADETTQLLFLVSEQLYYPVRTPLAIHHNVTRCFGSCFGWLIMGDTLSWVASFRIFLFNPSTKQRIHLPPYIGVQERNHNTKVILSSNPNDNDRALVVLKNHRSIVSLCRLGDKAWTSVGDTCRGLYDIILYQGILYGINYKYINNKNCIKMFIIDVGEDGKLHKRPFPPLLEAPQANDMDYFLVESEGELLIVTQRNRNCSSDSVYYGDVFFEAYEFGFFKLDFETHSWVELTTLGDRMLLLDPACSVSLDATKLSHYSFKANCIYYTNRGRRGCNDDYGWHKYHLKDRKIVPFEVDFSTILPLSPAPILA